MEKSKKKDIIKKVLITLLVCGIIVAIVCTTLHFTTNKYVKDYISIPVYTLSSENTNIVDKTSSYLGHPDLIMTDSGKLLCVYPSGHGKGAIIMKSSLDNGKTWSERMLDLPSSWKNSQETPILYKLKLKNGSSKIILTSGCPTWPGDKSYKANGFNCSVSSDDGESFSQFTNWYGIDWANKNNSEAFDCIVAMSSLTQLKENGEYVDKWLGTFHDHDFYNYYSILTFDNDENAVWSKPQKLLPNYHNDEKNYGICEIEMLRNPSDDTLILIARANKKKTRSLVCFSDDEGKSWTQPKQLPYELTGERHKAEYDSTTGKLVISFRQVLPIKPTAVSVQNFIGNSWVAWVGTYDDIMSYKDNDISNDKKGNCQIVLGTNNENGGADNGYSGIVVKDGNFVLVSYGYFDKTCTAPFIMCARFNLKDIIK